MNYFAIVVNKLRRRQGGVCHHCNIMLDGKVVCQYIIEPKNCGTDTLENVILVHPHCSTSGRKYRQKKLALKLIEEGKTVAEVALQLDLSRQTIYNYMKET